MFVAAKQCTDKGFMIRIIIFGFPLETYFFRLYSALKVGMQEVSGFDYFKIESTMKKGELNKNCNLQKRYCFVSALIFYFCLLALCRTVSNAMNVRRQRSVCVLSKAGGGFFLHPEINVCFSS